MNKNLSTILIVLAVLILAGGLFFAGSMYARFYAFGPGMTLAPGASAGGFGYSSNNDYSYGPGMMGRGNRYAMGPGMALAPGAHLPWVQVPGSAGVDRRGGYSWINGTNANLAPLTVDQAKQAAQKYIQSLNIQGLEISEVMVFDNNAYVAVKESSTGVGAFELLVDPASQVAYPEYGPNMMWNLKYGGLNHGSMMGGRSNMTLAPGASAGMQGWINQSTSPTNVSADMPVTQDQAIKNAQAYLDQYQPGTLAASDPMQFYGYYTLDFSKDGKVAGMLSVNGYNGQVFFHTWHGAFIEESK